MATGAAVDAHYPSWGFGTLADAPLVQQEVDLITPHGDLEPWRVRSTSVTTSTHYPSWGFGTRRTTCRRGCSTTHYPSWGFGTGRRGRTGRRPVWLITPHGDLEPSAHAAGVQSELQAHYPSWGFGTFWSGACGGHWSCASLPLMGIWNECRPARTPTGTSTHYPSWGFGTTLVNLKQETSHRSLPLMGIWNLPAFFFFGAGSFTSLPLMGIWNGDLVVVVVRRQRLITPHGDLEHEGHPDGDGPREQLITPHGDLERVALASSTRRPL